MRRGRAETEEESVSAHSEVGRGGGGHVQIGGRGGECTQKPAKGRVCSREVGSI